MQTTSAFKLRKLGALLAAALVVSTAPAVPAAVPFPSKHFTYRADGKKLTEVMQDFASSQGLPVVIDPGVDGTVNANFNTSAEQFLAAMTRTYGVIWYFDGTTLFIYPSRAMQSRVFRMRGYDRQQVRQMLGSLGLGDARFPLRFDDVNQTLLAYGPPRHIELVATVLGELERDGHDRMGKSILVVPLRYATAGERTFGDTKVPGHVVFTNPAGDGKTRAGLSTHIDRFRKGNPGAYFVTDKLYPQPDKLLAVWSMYKAESTKVATGYNFVRPDDDGRFGYMAGFF